MRPGEQFELESLEYLRKKYGKTGIEFIQNERGIGAEIMLDPDAHWTELFQFPEIPDSPISGFIKAGLVNQRLIGAAGAVVSSVPPTYLPILPVWPYSAQYI